MSIEGAGDKKFRLKLTGESIGQRLDLFLSSNAELNLSRNRIQKLIKDDKVLVNGKIPQKRLALSAGDIIELTLPLPKKSEITAENIDLDIRFEDEFLAVVNKPAGMVVHPAVGNRSGTLVNALMYHFENLAQGGGAERAGIVHRLDKNSSGLLLVAKTDVVHRELQKSLQERSIKREYLALVCGRLKDARGLIKTLIDRSKKDRKKWQLPKHREEKLSPSTNSRSAIEAINFLNFHYRPAVLTRFEFTWRIWGILSLVIRNMAAERNGTAAFLHRRDRWQRNFWKYFPGRLFTPKDWSLSIP